MSQALVLGGGGVAGIAWTTGLLAGLADAGQDFIGAELIVGTSAGSTVGALLGSGMGLDDMFARQVDPVLQAPEIMVEIDLANFVEKMKTALAGATEILEVRRAVGRFALDTDTVPEPARRAVIEARLPSGEWPERQLKIVAVDAHSGEARIFDRSSGVSLVDAVTASCAVPGVWPPATVGEHRYIDGGVRSGENADYAVGASRVLIVAPMGGAELFPTEKPLEQCIRELRGDGAVVAVVSPDEESRLAMGANPLDPSSRAPSAHAGRSQGRALTVELS